VAADRQENLFEPPSPIVRAEDLVAFRYSSYDVPFWVRPNTLAQRWNLALEGPTQYWSLTPDAAWAELIRFNELTTEGELDNVRIPIWVCRLPSMGLIDLRQPDARDRYRLTISDLTAEDWSACQSAATAMRSEGVRGILSPSAALASATNVTLFGPRRAIALDRHPALASAVPASVVAIGRPPAKLVQRVIRRAYPSRLFDLP
jgi:RES domain-containing protein